MTDGYVRWLALSPQGKYPVRAGHRTRPSEYVQAWERLESGVDPKAPLSGYYSDDARSSSLRRGREELRAVGASPRARAPSVGALSGEQPVA